MQIGALLLFLLASCSTPEPGEPSEAPASELPADPRPDVLLVIIDTLRADRTGLITPGLTPELAALPGARRYPQAISPSSLTQPSMASLFADEPVRAVNTGAFAGPSLASTFRKAGYDTAGITANPTLTRKAGFHRGFRVWRQRDARSAELAWQAEGLVDRALALHAAAKEGPTFLYVHLFDPHLPYRSEGPLDPAPGWSQLPADPFLADLPEDQQRCVLEVRQQYDREVAASGGDPRAALALGPRRAAGGGRPSRAHPGPGWDPAGARGGAFAAQPPR